MYSPPDSSRLPGGTTVPAAIITSSSTTAPSSTIAPMPTSTRWPMVQPWTVTPCAITTSSPMISGQPASLPGKGRVTCSTLPSWTLLRAPMRM